MAPDGLSDSDAAAMEAWVVAANSWSETAQALVGAAAGLALASRSLADSVDDGPRPAVAEAEASEAGALAVSLRLLGDEVERETAGLRDRYLATAANIEQYRDILS
jgi:hypothetical protein